MIRPGFPNPFKSEMYQFAQVGCPTKQTITSLLRIFITPCGEVGKGSRIELGWTSIWSYSIL